MATITVNTKYNPGDTVYRVTMASLNAGTPRFIVNVVSEVWNTLEYKHPHYILEGMPQSKFNEMYLFPNEDEARTGCIALRQKLAEAREKQRKIDLEQAFKDYRNHHCTALDAIIERIEYLGGEIKNSDEDN